MKAERKTPVTTELLHQLKLFEEIYRNTASLAALCAGEEPDQQQVDALLVKRQKMIEQTSRSQKVLQELGKEKNAGLDTPMARDILFEIRSVLEKTAFLDEKARNSLKARSNDVRNELFKLQKGRKVGKAYTATPRQSEGFFIDSQKN
ncbi:hypothetical protein [Dethiobacter alkaliphilus]|uniref:hypothetical protein n=1 Tax=Dethiobacter alkaliphilus TaxID=427926 RepID=UPI0022275F7E|nr:hypothetical protein [Dethiobacter alkaliphilus]MCW3488762.1 hypothetical protein [Dethiobacter alkaliphilus]